jgi:hypothetical protein
LLFQHSMKLSDDANDTNAAWKFDW